MYKYQGHTKKTYLFVIERIYFKFLKIFATRGLVIGRFSSIDTRSILVTIELIDKKDLSILLLRYSKTSGLGYICLSAKALP